MKVIRKVPGSACEIVDIDNTLESLQNQVEGYIELVYLPYGMVLVCNEEGVLLNKPFNCVVASTCDGRRPWNAVKICGTFIVCRLGSEDDFTSIEDKDASLFNTIFVEP